MCVPVFIAWLCLSSVWNPHWLIIGVLMLLITTPKRPYDKYYCICMSIHSQLTCGYFLLLHNIKIKRINFHKFLSSILCFSFSLLVGPVSKTTHCSSTARSFNIISNLCRHLISKPDWQPPPQPRPSLRARAVACQDQQYVVR